MSDDPVSVAKRALQAYVDSDRAAIEAVIGEGLTFTSPLDNRINRETYFERCWPNHERTAGFDVVSAVRDGERAIITYEGRTHDGKRFRNTEILTVRDGRIRQVEVYFGWSLPHEASEGGFVGPA